MEEQQLSLKEYPVIYVNKDDVDKKANLNLLINRWIEIKCPKYVNIWQNNNEISSNQDWNF